MSSSIILAGLGLAALGYGGRALMRQMPNAASKMQEALQNLPKFDAESMANSKYYRGGFDAKMNKREASLILGISPSASKIKKQERREENQKIQQQLKTIVLPICGVVFLCIVAYVFLKTRPRFEEL
ncbi:hypothetical protein quinque_002052 [Culex quinquefasciatus]